MKYIRWLAVPGGMEVELVEIRGAGSMASGYNEGMYSSNAKYKVYMHQDVFLINQYFIYDLISLFRKSEEIGMIGLVGSPKVPENGVMWSERRVGGLICHQCHGRSIGMILKRMAGGKWKESMDY